MLKKAGQRLLIGTIIVLIALLLALWAEGMTALKIAATALFLIGAVILLVSANSVQALMAARLREVGTWRKGMGQRIADVEQITSVLGEDAVSKEDLSALRETVVTKDQHSALRAGISSAQESLSGGLDAYGTRLAALESAESVRRERAAARDEALREAEAKRTAFEERSRSGRAADHVRLADLEGGLYELAIHAQVPLEAVITPRQAKLLVSRYARSSDYLRVKPLLDGFAEEHPQVLDQLDTVRLVAAYKTYKRFGYLKAQATVARRLLKRADSSVPAERLRASIEEAEFFSDVHSFEAPSIGDGHGVHDPAGPVVHVVGKTLPDTQTGYTLRTQYTARALQRREVESVILAQAGAPGGDPEQVVAQEVGGIRCMIVPGPVRYETTYSAWLSGTITESAAIIRELRPSVLHAHSDFLNAMVAVHIGRAFGIPVVYESRGFWEESWLSRTLDANDLTGRYDALVRRCGVPEAHSWRQRAEIELRAASAVNLTLGRTMREHVLELAEPGSMAREDIPLVPNGIENGQFSAMAKDDQLMAELDIRPDEVVIGCVTSIVEYEGIDLLVRAFAELEKDASTGPRPRLLVVGDGPMRESLEGLVQELDLEGAVFTGRVPHEDVTRYYGLIDVFVVPRRPTPVSRLVTPLKPFEALAAGKALVVSDVEALAEIAEDAGGAVASFRAGDVSDLRRVLSDLIEDPVRRATMGSRGAQWVSRERTWDANAAVYAAVYRELGAIVP